MPPGIGRAIDRKEESRPYCGLVTKDRGEVEHGDAVLCQSFLQGILEIGHGVAKQWEVGFFLTRLEHHEDRRTVRPRLRLQTLQRLQHEVEGMLVRLCFGTRGFELVRKQVKPHAIQTANVGGARPRRPYQLKEIAVPAQERMEGIKGMGEA